MVFSATTFEKINKILKKQRNDNKKLLEADTTAPQDKAQDKAQDQTQDQENKDFTIEAIDKIKQLYGGNPQEILKKMKTSTIAGLLRNESKCEARLVGTTTYNSGLLGYPAVSVLFNYMLDSNSKDEIRITAYDEGDPFSVWGILYFCPFTKNGTHENNDMILDTKDIKTVSVFMQIVSFESASYFIKYVDKKPTMINSKIDDCEERFAGFAHLELKDIIENARKTKILKENLRNGKLLTTHDEYKIPVDISIKKGKLLTMIYENLVEVEEEKKQKQKKDDNFNSLHNAFIFFVNHVLAYYSDKNIEPLIAIEKQYCGGKSQAEDEYNETREELDPDIVRSYGSISMDDVKKVEEEKADEEEKEKEEDEYDGSVDSDDDEDSDGENSLLEFTYTPTYRSNLYQSNLFEKKVTSYISEKTNKKSKEEEEDIASRYFGNSVLGEIAVKVREYYREGQFDKDAEEIIIN